MTPQAFAADLATIPAMDDLTVRICSGGGDVWAAQAIGAMLENRLGTVTAQIEGICASAATIVASHCKVVKAAEDATYMIHPIKVNPNGFVDMEGLKQLMDALTVMRTNVLNQYAKKTGHTVEEVAAWMDATSWWTAAEAKENGFIDEITESNQTAKIENRNGALFVNSIAVPGTFDDAPEFVRNRAVVAPATTEGFVNNTDPAGKPDKNDGGNDMEFKNADELRNGCPDLVKEIVVLRSSLLTVRRWMQRRRATNCWMIPKMMQIPAAQTALAVLPRTVSLALARRTRTRPTPKSVRWSRTCSTRRRRAKRWLKKC